MSFSLSFFVVDAITVVFVAVVVVVAFFVSFLTATILSDNVRLLFRSFYLPLSLFLSLSRLFSLPLCLSRSVFCDSSDSMHRQVYIAQLCYVECRQKCIHFMQSIHMQKDKTEYQSNHKIEIDE